MAPENPDFLGGESGLGTPLTGRGQSNFQKILEVWGRDPIILGIETKIGNFKAMSISWEGFWREMGLDLMEKWGWRWRGIWGKLTI